MEEISLLGSIELRVRGKALAPGSLKEACVLAVLAVECGRVVSTDMMARRVWGQHPPQNARTTLTSYLSRLRGRLRRATGGTPPIASKAGGHTLTVDRDIIDLHRFRRLYRQARAIAGTGDDQHALELLTEAEGLWRGEPLAGLPGDWARNLRESLEEERHAVRLERVELQLRLGRHREVVGELRELAAARPFDETVTAHLMTALYRCDRQADALTAYRSLHRRLAAEHGSEPSPRLRTLHERILRQDTELAAVPRYRDAALNGTLPPDIPDFTGRDRELRQLLDPEQTGVTVITGMAGVGKSALALHAAHRLARRFPDGRIHLDLYGHHPQRPPLSAPAVLAELLRLTGVPATRIPADPIRRAEAWREEMAHRRAVIVLDDATDVEQFGPVVAGAPNCRILVTSRRRLIGPAGARHLSLDVLPPADAAELVARIAGGGLDRRVADDIVARSGGLPLALRLVARAVPAVPGTDGLVGEFLTGVRDGAARAAFELSYRALDERHRRVFRRLGLLPCTDFTVATIAACADLPVEALRPAFDAMLDHHLLQEHQPGRLRMHDLVREFARARSVAEDTGYERRRFLLQLLDHYLRDAARADRRLHPHRRRLLVPRTPEPVTDAEARRWFREEWRNALSVADHAFACERQREGVLMVHLLCAFLETQGGHTAARQALETALRAARETEEPELVARVLTDLGFALFRLGDHTEALQRYGEALPIHRGLGDRQAEAETLDRVGMVLCATARYREAQAHFQEAWALYRSAGDLHGEADTLAHTAISLWHLGRYPEAIRHLRRALEGYRAVGDRRGEAKTLNNIGEVQRQRGYHRDAMRCYLESSEIFQDIDGVQNAAIIAGNIGYVHHYKGDYAQARACYREAVTVFRDTGDRRNVADTLIGLGATYLMEGRTAEALIHFQNAEELATQVEDPYQHTRALCGMADAHRMNGQLQTALDVYRRAGEIARDISDLYQEARAHEGIAQTTFLLRGPNEARIHWRQALAIYQELGVPEAKTVAIRLQDLDGVDHELG